MWIELKETREFVPVNEQQTEKVFFDGNKGWAIKQKDGKTYHITEEQRLELDKEINPQEYWKRKEESNNLSDTETKRIRKLLEKLEDDEERKHRHKRDD